MNMPDNNRYNNFLKKKVLTVTDAGFDIDRDQLNENLFDFQKDIVKWALRKGRSAVFADCGLGKTAMQLEWAHQVFLQTGGNVLILAPLGVTYQTATEAEKFNIPAHIARKQSDIQPGINISNYEMLHHFEPESFIGIVLDESSILKNYMGKRKMLILERFKETPYKLCCTATPSPNDHMEILNHAEFLNVMRSTEALSIWFINDTMNFGTYRLKNHAKTDFWRWVSSWAVSLSKPSDIGYNDAGYELPPLNVKEIIVDVDTSEATDGMLFRMADMSATGYHKEKRLTSAERAAAVAEIVNNSNEQFVIWCETNYEADELVKVLPDAVEVRGSDKPDDKERAALDFIAGKIRVIISKPKIFGFGLNFQNCHNTIFCGLSYSYEMFYQATRRFWRFGQNNPVNCMIVIGETERQILSTIKDKETRFEEMKHSMNVLMAEFQTVNRKVEFQMDYERKTIELQDATLILGDSCVEVKTIADNSVDFQIFSPPFSNYYIYSDSYRDMGNVKDDEQFFEQFRFLIPELLRISKPGRLCAVHCKDLVLYKGRDGAAGLRDFPGDLIHEFLQAGWIFHSRVTIWKDPVIEMQRTKANGLLHKTIKRNGSYSRQGMPDYLLIFRKWTEGENEHPIERPRGFDYYIGENAPDGMRYVSDQFNDYDSEGYSIQIWQRYASPVWFDIQQTNVLNTRIAKDNEDEKHICPLQLDVIERAIHLWTNEGETVFTPFMGIGSEVYSALKLNRKGLGIELKESYFKEAEKNVREILHKKSELSLFDLLTA